MDEVLRSAREREERAREELLREIAADVRNLQRAARDVEGGNGAAYRTGILQSSRVDVAAAALATATEARDEVEAIAAEVQR